MERKDRLYHEISIPAVRYIPFHLFQKGETKWDTASIRAKELAMVHFWIDANVIIRILFKPRIRNKAKNPYQLWSIA